MQTKCICPEGKQCKQDAFVLKVKCKQDVQGSILEPLLFLLYINDTVDEIQTNIHLFADYTSLFVITDNPETNLAVLNSDLAKIMEEKCFHKWHGHK